MSEFFSWDLIDLTKVRKTSEKLLQRVLYVATPGKRKMINV